MSLWPYHLGKALRHMIRRPMASIGSILSMLLLLLLFDLVWVAALSTGEYYRRVISNIDIEVFLQESLPDSSVSPIREAILQMDGVGEVTHISRDNARLRLYDLMGTDLLEGFEENPLPRSLIINFKENYLNGDRLETFRAELMRLSGVSEIYYAKNWLEKGEYGITMAGRVAAILGLMIFTAVLLNLIHATRLSVRVHEIELRQLNLMGAGRWFLSVPYLIEGMINIMIAAIAGWLILYYGSQNLTFQDVSLIFPTFEELVYFFLAVIFLGFVGGLIGSRRSLW
jgi:cell division transport system permease protein